MIQFRTAYDEGVPRWLDGWVRVPAESIDEAFEQYGHVAMSYLHVLAVATNAAIAMPHLTMVYEATAGNAPCMIQRLGVPSPPLVAHRTIDGELTVRLLTKVLDHPMHERLRRAMEHYATALRLTDPASPIEAANTLFICAETLTPVVVARLMEASGFETKYEWARSLGFEKLNDADAHVRRTVIFGGDDGVYKSLKSLSDGFEHGYHDFGTTRSLAEEAAFPAAALIRAAILRETGIPEADVAALLGGIRERPLPLWPTRVFTAGVMHARPEKVAPDAPPIVFDLVVTPSLHQFDPESHLVGGKMDVRVRSTVDGSPTFDAIKYVINGPGVLEPVDPELEGSASDG